MSVRPHRGKSAPNLDGKYYKFKLEKLPSDVHISDPDASPAANISNDREPFVLMLMPKSRTRVAVPEPTTAVDVAHIPTDASSTEAFGAASEITPDALSEEVTGLIEHLHLPRAAANSDGAGTLERAVALKTQGNQEYAAGEFPRALRLYSEAVEMLEGAGEDAALATLLCNRSVAYLKATLKKRLDRERSAHPCTDSLSKAIQVSLHPTGVRVPLS